MKTEPGSDSGNRARPSTLARLRQNLMRHRRLLVTVTALALLLGAGGWFGIERSHTVRVVCDVREICSVRLPDQRLLQIRFVTPPQRLRPFDLEVYGARPDYVSFAMPGMEMGFNRYQLQAVEQHWRGRMALPRCISGKGDWLLRIHLGRTTAELVFRME